MHRAARAEGSSLHHTAMLYVDEGYRHSVLLIYHQAFPPNKGCMQAPEQGKHAAMPVCKGTLTKGAFDRCNMILGNVLILDCEHCCRKAAT